MAIAQEWRRYDFKIDIPLNNLFLQANGIEGGVEDYGRSAFLIIHWARQNGGDVLP